MKPPTDPANATSLSVLIVDDAKVIVDVMSQFLAMLGHRATTASSGREAIEMLSTRGQDFDVIFSDISMPDMDGHALATQIRARRDAGSIRTRMLVAMSGYGDPEEKERSLASGFDRHVVKPADLDALEALLNEAAQSV